MNMPERGLAKSQPQPGGRKREGKILGCASIVPNREMMTSLDPVEDPFGDVTRMSRALPVSVGGSCAIIVAPSTRRSAAIA
jgi:hypothetical protein